MALTRCQQFQEDVEAVIAVEELPFLSQHGGDGEGLCRREVRNDFEVEVRML